MLNANPELNDQKFNSSVSRDQIDPQDPIYGSLLNETGITPVGYKMLIEIPEPKTSKGLIAIPESVKAREKTATVVARVVQLGADCYRDQNRYPRGPWCKPGDYVAMSPYNGTRIVSPKTNTDLRFINEDSIDGVVESPELVERG